MREATIYVRRYQQASNTNHSALQRKIAYAVGAIKSKEQAQCEVNSLPEEDPNHLRQAVAEAAKHANTAPRIWDLRASRTESNISKNKSDVKGWQTNCRDIHDNNISSLPVQGK
jgi:hypothetical protein